MLIGLLRDSRIQAVSESAHFPPCTLPPTPVQPKCPPCFDPEPVPPEEPAPNAEAILASEQPVAWKKSPAWKPSSSSSECWQWCGYSQWVYYQHSWRGYNSRWSRRSWRHSSDYSWYPWRSWAGCSCWQSRGRCWCWKDRRRSDRYSQRDRGVSAEARLARELPAQMADLLFREITPDDYELLLQLDDKVARPTVSKNEVESLPQVCVEEVLGETCMVCLDNFRSMDDVSLLPSCGHCFHRLCVAKWLLERHRVCPLCNVEVFPTK